jgi:hypothetical protein
MSDIDRQRVTAVRILQEIGYLFRDGDWVRGPVASPSTAETDRLHALLVMRADELESCPKGSSDEAQAEAIVDALEAYEAVRWPEGKVWGGKG